MSDKPASSVASATASSSSLLLMEPLKLNESITLRNRVVLPPMVTMRGLTTPAGLKWYDERSVAGGPGLVIVEATSVSQFLPTSTTSTVLHAVDLQPLATRIKNNGSVACIQLFPDMGNGPRPLRAADLTKQDIAELTEAFVFAARVCCLGAGFQGVQIHGGHGYILNQFSDPTLNNRTDEYGPQDAARLACEIIAAIKKDLNNHSLIMYRHSPNPVQTTEQAAGVAAHLAARLKGVGLDLMDVSPGGTYQHPGSVTQLMKQLDEYPHDLPLICGLGMGDITRSTTVLAEHRADLVAVGRQLIADPKWVQKIAAGKQDTIVQCIQCNMECYGNLQKNVPISCMRWSNEIDTSSVPNIELFAPHQKRSTCCGKSAQIDIESAADTLIYKRSAPIVEEMATTATTERPVARPSLIWPPVNMQKIPAIFSKSIPSTPSPGSLPSEDQSIGSSPPLTQQRRVIHVLTTPTPATQLPTLSSII